MPTSPSMEPPAFRLTWTHLWLAPLFVALTAVQWSLALPQPTLEDLSPGLTVSAPPYVRPDGCPSRRWSQREFIPHACLWENLFPPGGYDAAGLTPIYPGGRNSTPHWHVWVRADTDALGVSCALAGGCKILTVVRDRYGVAARAPGAGEPAPYGPRISYAVSTAVYLCLWNGPFLLLGAGMIELLRRKRALRS